MNPGDLIAGYAAVMATIALGWQVWRERQAHRLRLTVKLESLGPSGKDGEQSWVLWISVINASEYDVRVARVTIGQLIGSELDGRSLMTVKGNELPGTIPARDSRTELLHPEVGLLGVPAVQV
jgi:hypothetical protein